MIKIVFAMGSNYAFGNKGALPWPHCKRDMKNFVAQTSYTGTTQPVMLMGASTFCSLPSKLKGRVHAVMSSKHRDAILTKNNNRSDMVFGGDVVNALGELSRVHDHICVIGGIGIIRDSLSLADEINLTVFDGEYEHDVSVPTDVLDTINNKFELVSLVRYGDENITIKHYKRKK